MLLAARPPPCRPWKWGFVAVQHRLSSSSSYRNRVAAAAGEPGSREGAGAEPAERRASSLNSSSSSSSTSDEDAVAAVLARAGLDPAELQRQVPDSYSDFLSLALAEVLAEVHADWAARGRGTRTPAAVLAARICFLAWEVGLRVAEIRDWHRRDWRFLFFALDNARRLHSWLQLQGLSTDQLRLAIRNHVTFWASDVVTLQRCKEHVQQQLSVTDSQWCKACTTDPQSMRASPDGVDSIIDWLEAKPLGFSRAEVAKIWQGQPRFFSLPPDVLQQRLEFLQEYGFDEEQLSKVLLRNPMALGSSLAEKVESTLAALQNVLGSQEDVVAAVAKCPSLLVSAVETIEGNMEVMAKLGLSPADMRKSVGKQPQLFGYDYKVEDFRAKLRYCEVVLGRSPRHMLVEQPKALKSALWRVDYRVSFMEHKGDTHHKATLSWLGLSDKQFCEMYKYSLAEFEGWGEQWVRSERARQYGLDKAREPRMARAIQARDRRRKAKVATRRRKVLAADEE